MISTWIKFLLLFLAISNEQLNERSDNRLTRIVNFCFPLIKTTPLHSNQLIFKLSLKQWSYFNKRYISDSWRVLQQQGYLFGCRKWRPLVILLVTRSLVEKGDRIQDRCADAIPAKFDDTDFNYLFTDKLV